MSAAVILDADDRLLLVRKRGTTAFMQPGGKPEPGEDARQTLIRELHEEIGILLPAERVQPLGEYRAHAANEPGFIVVADVFTADIAQATPRIAAEIEELRWVRRADAEGLDVAPLAREYFLR